MKPLKINYIPNIWPATNTPWSEKDLKNLLELQKIYNAAIKNRPQWRYIRYVTLKKFINENQDLTRISKKVAGIRNVKIVQGGHDFSLKEMIIQLMELKVFSIASLARLLGNNENEIYKYAELNKDSIAIGISKESIITELLLFRKWWLNKK